MTIKSGALGGGISRLGRLLINIIYGLAVVVGSAFAAYNLYGFIIISFMFGLTVGMLAIPSNIISLGYWLVVSSLVVRSSTRARRYRPQYWVPVLLGLPLVACSSYFLIETYRGY
jgi:hypothetical protein